MKKITSLVFAIISTLLLATGAARAAEKFDGHTEKVGPVMDGPSMPCIVTDDN